MFFQFFFFLFVIVVLAFLPSLPVYISTLKSFQVNVVFFVCQEGWCKKLINCEIHPASQQKQLHTIKFLFHVIIISRFVHVELHNLFICKLFNAFIHNHIIYEIFSSLHDKIFLFFASWQVYNSIVSMVMSPFCQRERS